MIHTTTRIRESRLNKKGETRILLVLYDNKETKEISTGISVSPDNWDKKRNRIKPKDPRAQVKNSSLNKFKNRVQQNIDRCIGLDPRTSIKTIIELVKGEKSSSTKFTEVLNDYIKVNPDSLSDGTLEYYDICLTRINEFSPEVTLESIDVEWLQSFESHLKNKYNNTYNTIFNRLKVVRKMLRRALANGTINKNPFDHFKIKTTETQRDYLIKDEIIRLVDIDGLSGVTELTRDSYVFSCVSGGLRFSDVAKLEEHAILYEDDIVKLRVRMSKGNTLTIFKLTKLAISILKKYKNKGYGNYCFPIITKPLKGKSLRKHIGSRNAYFNRRLQVLAQMADIDKHLTFHTSRHTFATLMLNEGIQTEVVSKILGHKELKTTQIYTKIIDRKKDEAMDAMDNLIK